MSRGYVYLEIRKTPVGLAEGVEVDNVSVGLMVCSFTVTVDVSMVVVGTLILDVVVILGSVTKEPKFQQKYNVLTSILNVKWEGITVSCTVVG